MSDDPRITQLANDSIRKIPRTFRRAARQQHCVAVHRGFECVRQPLQIVWNNAEINRFAAEFLNCCCQRRAVAIEHPAGPSRFTRQNDFVTRRQDGDSRFAKDFNVRSTDRGQDTDFARGQFDTAPQNSLTASNIRPRKRDVLPRRHRTSNDQIGS